MSDAWRKGVEARVTALDFLMEGLWAQAMAALPAEQAESVLASLQQASTRFALTLGNPPQDAAIVQEDHRAAEAWIGPLIDRIRATEQLLRRHRPSGKTQ